MPPGVNLVHDFDLKYLYDYMTITPAKSCKVITFTILCVLPELD